MSGFFWKIVVIIVQSGLKPYNFTILAAGGELVDWCNWSWSYELLIDVIDYLLMLLITHRWPIDYSSTIILPTKDTFLAFLYYFFHWWFFICVRRIFLYNWRSCWRNYTFTKGNERLHQLQIQEPNFPTCKKWPLRPCLKKADIRLKE